MTHHTSPHTFHIPVMGLSYTIDTPIKVAQFGIDSVISIVDDELIEKMNALYSNKFSLPYKEITTKMADFRAERITSYLNLVDRIVKKKFSSFCNDLADNRQTLQKFINMLPQASAIRQGLQFYAGSVFDKSNEVRNYLAKHFQPGAIDVNIMTKVDRANYDKNIKQPVAFNDAHSALRGFAQSNLSSSLVLSAGMNPSLYNYIAEFSDFFPDNKGYLKKKIILKVSDFRSAMIQGSFLAKKGIWVSEYRIESGLNCGGHAFATDGLLLGPIMEEFKQRKEELVTSSYALLTKAYVQLGKDLPSNALGLKITVQGGVGTAKEHEFLLDYYNADSVGWGSPFLLVPEATTTDAETRKLLSRAKESDFYRSDISPLGVPFNTVSGTSNEYFKNRRIEQNKAGSSCPRKLLALNPEYDEQGLCTASRKYQQIKLNELELQKELLAIDALKEKKEAITVKSCLCIGLVNSAYIENNITIKGESQGVVICPGPNMAYFKKDVSLYDMIGHIYGYSSVLDNISRPNFLIKELELYVDYLAKEVNDTVKEITAIQVKKWNVFKTNLLNGIAYYEELFAKHRFHYLENQDIFKTLNDYKLRLQGIDVPV